ncbi:MAG: hypothetical protein HYU97_04110 [Deltaproteobacteria bacterium]|nr:hypothetical protein [Deltaproteobacteria bacterium]
MGCLCCRPSKAVLFLVSLAILPFSGLLSCGSTSGVNLSDLTFSELNEAVQTKYSDLNSTLVTYVQADQDLATSLAASSTSGSQMISDLEAALAAGDAYVSAVDSYTDYMEEYGSRLTSASISSLNPLTSQGEEGSMISFQGVDPIGAAQMAAMMSNCRQQVEACIALAPNDPEDVDRLICLHALTTKCLAKSASMMISGLVGTGAAALTGLALAPLVPVTITVTAAAGISLGVGVVVGVVWDFCTSSSSISAGNLTNLDSNSGSCAHATRNLSYSGSNLATSLPQGTGTLRVHIAGCAAIYQTATVGSGGLHVNVKCVDDGTSESAANDNNDDTTTESSAQDSGDGTCSTVQTIGLSPSPSDPAPNQAVVVTATVFPVASSCTIAFSISGTDGYSKSESPTTSSSGAASFTIPGGASGVVDTVTATSNGLSNTVVYVF